jgi:hypothetical protein
MLDVHLADFVCHSVYPLLGPMYSMHSKAPAQEELKKAFEDLFVKYKVDVAFWSETNRIGVARWPLSSLSSSSLPWC